MKKLLSLALLFAANCALAQTFPVQNLQVNGNSTFAGTSTFNGSTSVVNHGSGGSTLTLDGSANTTNGAQIHLLGNGVTNPGKYLAVVNGVLQVINSAGSADLFTIDDAGNAATAGTFAAAGTISATSSSANVLSLNGSGSSAGAQIQLIGNGGTTPNKYIRAIGGTLAFLNSADNANLMTLLDNGNVVFPANVTAASFSGPINAATPLTVGSSLFPNITPAVTTTATSSNGSPTINVTSATGLAVGMGAYSSFVSSCSSAVAAFTQARITGISGTSITLSCPATATNGSPVSVQFGQPRYDPTSSLLANDVGTQTLKVGSASQGNSAAWLNQVSAGQDFRFTSAAQIVTPPGGGYALTVAARTSDATGGAAAFPFQSILYADSWGNSSFGSENAYLQDNLAAATAGHAIHIQMEQSINSNWGSPPGEDPYTTNQTNQTIGHRYDCGTGQSAAPFPNNCTTAIEIVTNPMSFENGIVIANGALDTGGGARMGAAMAMPVNTGLIWFSGPGVFSGDVESSSAGIMNYVATAGGQHQFAVGGSNEFSVLGTATYQRPQSFSATTAGVGCNSGNEGFQASITDGSTSTFNAVVSGGGANHVAMRCNGSNWVVY